MANIVHNAMVSILKFLLATEELSFLILFYT